MNWNREYLKFWIKDRRLIDRTRDDGRLDDTRIHDAIEDALIQVGLDCSLIGETLRFPIVSGQWEYPMPDNVNDIRAARFIDSSGNYQRLHYTSSNKLINGRNPSTDTSGEPIFFSYPRFQGRVLSLWAGAPPTSDYVAESHVTTARIRTVQDSGINFGKTLSGERISPGRVVHNMTDDSYGYVEVLDLITTTSSGTATSGTNTNTLEDTGATFSTDGVAIGDIICTPSSGTVTGYAFVTAVTETKLTYDDFYASNTALRFASGDTYKVGKAQKIRLSEDTPHPGLREGATNDFTVGSAKATITGTTFTDTTVTGSSTSGAEAGDIAIASGGSHGLVEEVDDNELTVDKWIGGTPSAAESVVCKECDKYQIQTEFKVEKVLQLAPTPSSGDSTGDESIEILCNVLAKLPTRDSDPIEIPQHYMELLLTCLEWKASRRAGDELGMVERLEARYYTKMPAYQKDVYRPPVETVMTAFGNRRRGRVRESRYMTRAGWKWDIDSV